MKEKIVEYGTTHSVTVLSADNNIITVVADDINEGFLLIGHGLENLPKEKDKGRIVFEKDNRRGHWQYYPNKQNA